MKKVCGEDEIVDLLRNVAYRVVTKYQNADPYFTSVDSLEGHITYVPTYEEYMEEMNEREDIFSVFDQYHSGHTLGVKKLIIALRDSGSELTKNQARDLIAVCIISNLTVAL